jgi:hypothetical protein
MDYPAGRIIEVDADENGIALRVADRDPLVKRNENIARTRHHRLQLRFAQLAVHAARDIECDGLFGWAVATIRTAIFSSVAGINRHRVEGVDRILGGGLTSRQETGEAQSKSEANQSRHSDWISEVARSAKFFGGMSTAVDKFFGVA